MGPRRKGSETGMGGTFDSQIPELLSEHVPAERARQDTSRTS
jgi:hypothetical protein